MANSMTRRLVAIGCVVVAVGVSLWCSGVLSTYLAPVGESVRARLGLSDAEVTSSCPGGASNNTRGRSSLSAGAADADTDAMKEEFAQLMQKRRKALVLYQMSRDLLAESRRGQTGGGNSDMLAATKYREAAMAVESAIDKHPRMIALRESYATAESNKVEVSRQQAEILDEWDRQKKATGNDFSKTIADASKKAVDARNALMAKAGVKNEANLPERERKRLKDIEAGMAVEIRNARARYSEFISEKATSEMREKDGSANRFRDVCVKYREVEKEQEDIKSSMLRLRTELRKSDPAIAALQNVAGAASQEYLTAVQSRPDVAAAQKFVDGIDQVYGDIDSRARILRNRILAVDPGYRQVMDSQAVAGGLAMVSEDFWKDGVSDRRLRTDAIAPTGAGNG